MSDATSQMGGASTLSSNQNPRKLHRKLSQIADKALNMPKLTALGKLMLRIISFASKSSQKQILKKAMPKKMLT